MTMVISAFAGLTLNVSAANGEAGGVLTIDSATSASGNGWDWNGSVLTLSGANLTRIVLNVDAAILLEGTNKLTATSGDEALMASTKSVTISGSGVLETPTINAKSLTIESGRIDVSSQNSVAIATQSMIVNGGYLTSKSTSGAAINIMVGGYKQTGGYVKAESTAANYYGLFSVQDIDVSGGYLEAVNTGNTAAGLRISSIGGAYTVKNSGGVINAVGSQYGISGKLVATGGVTIARYTVAEDYNKAIQNTITGLTDGGEKLYDNTGTAPVLASTNASGFSTLSSVVIAKETYGTAQAALTTLDGTYIFLPNGSDAIALEVANDISVTGGSYIESTNDFGIWAEGCEVVIGTDSLDNHATLVTIGRGGDGMYAGNIEVKAGATLYANSTSDIGIRYAGNGTFTNNGCTIAAGDMGVYSNGGSLTVSDGYFCGIGNALSGIISRLYAQGGYITAGSASMAGTDSEAGYQYGTSPLFSGTAEMTAYNTSTGLAYGSLNFDGVGFGAYGSASAVTPTPIAAATYDNDNYTYNIGANAAQVVVIKKIPQINYTLYYNATDGKLHINSLSGAEYSGGAGTWSGSGSVLTLSGFEFGTTAPEALVMPAGATIALATRSTNVIETAYTGALANSVIKGVGALTISGGGALLIGAGENASASATEGRALYTEGNLTIDGAYVTAGIRAAAKGSIAGIAVRAALIVKNEATVTAETGASTNGNTAITVSTDITVTGESQITAEVGTNSASGEAIYTDTGVITVTDSYIEATGGAQGLFASNGSIVINSSWIYTKGYSQAVKCGGTLTLNDVETLVSQSYAEAPNAVFNSANLNSYKCLRTYMVNAYVDEVTVNGVTGTPVIDREVYISLDSEWFTSISEGTDVSEWFANLPAGLSAEVAYYVDNYDDEVYITISGTPSVISDEVMEITIPADYLGRSVDLTVTSNPLALFDITSGQTPPPASSLTVTLYYDITATAGEGGTISPDGKSSVVSGGSRSYAITANEGYSIASVKVDGVDKGALEAYEFTDVTASHTIDVAFEKNYTIENETEEPWTPEETGDGLDFTLSGAEEAPAEIRINGEVISSDNYIISDDGAKITLKPEFLATLSEGEQALTVVYANGSVETKFNVAGVGGTGDEATKGDNPNTGEPLAGVFAVTAIAALVAICTVALGIFVKKRKNK